MVEGTTLEMWRRGNPTVSSNLTSSARPYRLTVRTPAFQAVNPGSIPGGVTYDKRSALRQVFCVCDRRSDVLHWQNREPGSRATLLTSKVDL